MAKRLLWIGVVLCGGALVFIGLLNFLGWAMLYHPHPYRSNYPKLLSRGVSPLAFRTSAGRQTAIYFRPNDGAGLPDRIWVVFGGNGSLALDWLPLAARAQAPGDAFLLIDYPGYGRSEGRPTLTNTRAAAEGALDASARWLRVEPRTLEPRLDVIGHSLGAAVALDFAMHHPRVHRIILLAPFNSLREEGAFFIGATLSHLAEDELGQPGRIAPPRATPTSTAGHHFSRAAGSLNPS